MNIPGAPRSHKAYDPTRSQLRRAEAARDEALNHLHRLIRRGAARSRLEIYKCRHCGAYHVGHKIGSGGRHR